MREQIWVTAIKILRGNLNVSLKGHIFLLTSLQMSSESCPQGTGKASPWIPQSHPWAFLAPSLIPTKSLQPGPYVCFTGYMNFGRCFNLQKAAEDLQARKKPQTWVIIPTLGEQKRLSAPDLVYPMTERRYTNLRIVLQERVRRMMQLC